VIDLDILRKAAYKVADYLLSSAVSFERIGLNPSGDATLKFDYIAEGILISEISNSVRDCLMFVTEERGIVKTCSDPKYVVIVDPVDGSANFTANIPWISTSIAVAPFRRGVRGSDVKWALVYEVHRHTSYEFSEGEALINGKIAERNERTADILLAYFDDPASFNSIRKFIASNPGVKVRSLGSAALDIVYVGLSRVLGFLDTRSRLRNLDVVAALRFARSLGAAEYLCGYTLVDNIELDKLVKIPCVVVGKDADTLKRLTNALDVNISA